MNTIKFKFLLMVVVFFFSQNASAEIYKCVSSQGKTYYNDIPCPKNDSETQLKHVKDPKNGYKPLVLKSEKNDQATEGVNTEKQNLSKSGESHKQGGQATNQLEGNNQNNDLNLSENSASTRERSLNSSKNATTENSSITLQTNNQLKVVDETPESKDKIR